MQAIKEGNHQQLLMPGNLGQIFTSTNQFSANLKLESDSGCKKESIAHFSNILPILYRPQPNFHDMIPSKPPNFDILTTLSCSFGHKYILLTVKYCIQVFWRCWRSGLEIYCVCLSTTVVGEQILRMWHKMDFQQLVKLR